MKWWYYIVGIPHVLCYAFFHKKDCDIDFDLARYTVGGKTGIGPFVGVLAQKEYRYIFYYRLPFVLRHSLNVILPQTKMCYLRSTRPAEGGG